MEDVQSKPGRVGRAVFRNPVMVVPAMGGSALVLILAIAGLPVAKSGAVIGAVVFSVVLGFVAVAGWWSKVVISVDGVRLDSLFVQHVIPWSQFRGFVVDSGLNVQLADGRKIAIFSYGGSLAGALTKYRGLKKARDRMEQACSEMPKNTGGSQKYVTRIKITWWPLALYLILLEGIVILSQAARR